MKREAVTEKTRQVAAGQEITRAKPSTEPASVGELYGCLCHQAFDSFPVSASTADQNDERLTIRNLPLSRASKKEGSTWGTPLF
jgi:hypothetical protein